MTIGDLVRFQDGRFFNGAVQLGWVTERPELARQVAAAYVFHGPRYHGVAASETEGVDRSSRLTDTASLLRDLLASMRAAADGQDTNPYRLAIAGYGSGKSHLSVTLAELLADPSGETATGILDNLRQADPDIARDVERLLAQIGKPVLVLPLDGSQAFHLGTALSRTVFARLAAAGIDADAVRELSPRFQIAEQFVQRNYPFRADAFAAALPGRDASAIGAALREQDEDCFDAVNAIYDDANGHPIPIAGQESAQALIETLCNVYCGKDGPFSHVLVLFDELGLYLEHAAEHPERAGDRVLQEIFQAVQDHGSQCHFVGFIQYELKSYLKRFGAADQKHLYRFISRFEVSEKLHLSTNLETLFAHMIRKDETALDALWQCTDATRSGRETWQRLSMALPAFTERPVWADWNLFSRVIHRGGWPLHPFAVWLLTRQRDLVQQRSALAFVKDVLERLAEAEPRNGPHLRQVSAADLVLDYLLPELLAAEQGSGVAVAETLQALLTKHAGHLTRPEQLLLAGMAIIHKTGIGKQPCETIDALLSEATALDPTVIAAPLATLFELGAAEWNEDLGRYELLSDGASRAQFQHWMRTRRREISAEGIRQVFQRRGLADCALGPVKPDFAQERSISTPDWTFAADPVHLGIIEATMHRSFDEWLRATAATDPKGRILYLFIHEEDEMAAAEARLAACFASELERCGIAKAPIWIVGLDDRHGRIAEHLARLVILEEQASPAEQDSFRRFIPDEQERSRAALKEVATDALREQRFWVAGFTDPPTGPLMVAANQVFAEVYPLALSFPFDGFGTAGSTGAKDAVAIASALAAGQVNYAWLQSQPVKLRNRTNSLLTQGWEALSQNGEPMVPRQPQVRAIYQRIEEAHQQDPGRTLLQSYRELLGPPYGLNASSAAVLFGVLLGLRSPQRAVEHHGRQMPPAEWTGMAVSHRPGRQGFDETVLEQSRLRFFDADAESKWRELLDEWEGAERYDVKLKIARTAEQLFKLQQPPPTLATDYLRLKSESDRTAVLLTERRHQITELETAIQQSVISNNIQRALQFGAKAVQQARDLAESATWPPALARECTKLAADARQVVSSEVDSWVERQTCHSVQQVPDFRNRTEKESKWLAQLGFAEQSTRLTAKAQASIARVEALQRHTLTLAQCEDYPRQPIPSTAVSALAVTEDIRRGDSLAKAIRDIQLLSDVEKNAHISAIQRRQTQLKEVKTRQEAELGRLDEIIIDSEEALREARATVERLRQTFAGTQNETTINDLASVLGRMQADLETWETGTVSVERLAEILDEQSTRQAAYLRAWCEEHDIEPPPQWDLEAAYRALAGERIAAARRRSADWLRARTSLESRIQSLDRTACASLEGELLSAPAHLSESDRAQATRLYEAVQCRLTALQEIERSHQIAEWQQQFRNWQAGDRPDRRTTEHLLRVLNDPPWPLRPADLAWQGALATQLTTHLDELGLDDLVARIERLTPEMRQTLFARLSGLLRI